MKPVFAYILLSLTVCLFTACSKYADCDKEPTIRHYNLTSDEQARIPFTGQDTIVYISDAQDTVVAYSSLKQSEEYSGYSSGSPDCPDQTDVYMQIQKVQLTNGMIYYYRATMRDVFELGQDKSELWLYFGHADHKAVLDSLNTPSSYTSSVEINGTTYPCREIEPGSSMFYHYQYGVLQYQYLGKTYKMQID